MEIHQKVVLITGSAHRVGKVIATTLASKGAKIAVHYRTHKAEAEETAQKIETLGGKSMVLQGDISSRYDWENIRDNICGKWDTIDVLVNNAAIFYRTPFFKVTDQDWDKFMNVNLKGTFLGCQIIGEIMYNNQSGKIINIADVSAENVWPGFIPYCTSKAGVIALTKGMAQALAPHVTVNAVSPGTILLAENYDEEEENHLIQRTPLKRIGNPEDISNTVSFLIEGSNFITGTVINVDGGRSLT